MSHEHVAVNNTFLTLSSGLTVGATTVNFTAGHGLRLPAIASPQYMMGTLIRASTGELERVKITAHTGGADSCTVARNADGTTALTFSAGDKLEIRFGNADFEQLVRMGLLENALLAAGTVDALTGSLPKSLLPALVDPFVVLVKCTGANTITTPTFNLTLGTTATGAKTIVKGSNLPLEVGDIPGADWLAILSYDQSLDKWVLLNPAKPVYHILGGNLLRNGSFEEDSFGWTLTNFTGGSNTISTASHADGAKSLQFTSTNLANGGGDALSQEYINIGGGELIDFAFWIIGSVAGVSSKVEVHWYDNAKALLSTTVLKQLTSTPTAFTHYGVRQRAPASARFCRMRLTGGIPAVGSTTGSIRFDGVEVLRVDAETAEKRKAIPINLIKVGSLNHGDNAIGHFRNIHLSSDTEANVEFYVIEPLTISDLHALAAAAVPATETVVFVLRKNGADTALTCTINGGQTKASDQVNSVDFGYGDRFAIRATSSLGAGVNDYTATLKAKKFQREEGYPAFFFIGSQSTSPRYLPELGGAFDVGGINHGRHIPVGPCLASWFVFSKSTTGTQDSESLRVNNTLLSSQIDDGAGPVSSRGSDGRVVLVEGDRITCANDGTAATSVIGGNVFFRANNPDVEHDPCFIAFSSSSQAQATTAYLGGFGASQVTVEGDVAIPMPACTLKNLRGVVAAVPPAGQTLTLTVRKNGVDTGLTIQFTNGGGLTQNDLVNEVTFAAGDVLSIKSVTSATSGPMEVAVSLQAFAPLP